MLTKFIIAFSFMGLAFCPSVYAADLEVERAPGFLPDKFFVGKIINITKDAGDLDLEYGFAWIIDVKILSEEEKNQIVAIERRTIDDSPETLGIKIGEKVVVQKTEALSEVEYQIYDIYRIWPMVIILMIFFGLVIYLARLKGVGSVFGLIVSILILALYVVPNILSGHDPLITSLIGAVIIAVISIYLAHGFSKRTSISLLATMITLGISAILSIVFVSITKLSGIGSEESFYLQISGFDPLNLKGLLLGGIIIGALGVLDDITTGQAAAVQEIKNANPSLSVAELYKRGISVGKEHIASLVNTLVLAYAGASFPLFILFSINPNDHPLWVTMNSEFIAEEVIRTLVGSIVLVLAVPIATFLAAYFLKRESKL